MPSCPACRTRYPEDPSGDGHCPKDGEVLLDDAAFSNADVDLSASDPTTHARSDAAMEGVGPSPGKQTRRVALAGSVAIVVIVGAVFGLGGQGNPIPVTVGVASTLTPVASVTSPAAPDASNASTTSVSPGAASAVAVVVDSTPSGATVSLGAMSLGRTPASFTLPTGGVAVTLTVSSPGYKTGSIEVVPAAGVTRRIILKKSSPFDLPKF